MTAEMEKTTQKGGGKRKVIIIVSIIISFILISFFLIGTFYGRLYAINYIGIPITNSEDDLPPVNLYKINSDIYVPVTIDESTRKIKDNIPYYYGTLPQWAYDKVFDEIPYVPSDADAAGYVWNDFLYGLKWGTSPKTVYRAYVGHSDLGNDFRILSENGVETLVAKIEKCYSSNMHDDWYAYADELDILFDVQLRKKYGKDYTVVGINLKKSIYHVPSTDFTKGRFWHQFRKHLAFFASDVKGLFE